MLNPHPLRAFAQEHGDDPRFWTVNTRADAALAVIADDMARTGRADALAETLCEMLADTDTALQVQAALDIRDYQSLGELVIEHLADDWLDWMADQIDLYQMAWRAA